MWRKIGPADGKRIAVIGDGDENHLVASALSSAVQSLGNPVDFVSFDCPVEEFNDAIIHLNTHGLMGASICNPHKAAAAKLAVDYFRMRQALGVANALKLGSNIVAQNTEVAAFAAKIAHLEPATALVMGSGRAARSAIQALEEKEWKVRLWNRNVLRSKPLVAFFEYYGKVEQVSQPDPTGCSLIVNATTVGKKIGEQPPVLWQRAKQKSVCIDFVYRGVATEFLRSGAKLGFKTIDGRELLVEQAALALEWWLDTEVPRSPMLKAVGLKG